MESFDVLAILADDERSALSGKYVQNGSVGASQHLDVSVDAHQLKDALQVLPGTGDDQAGFRYEPQGDARQGLSAGKRVLVRIGQDLDVHKILAHAELAQTLRQRLLVGVA